VRTNRIGIGRIRILAGLLLVAIVAPACGGSGKTKTTTVSVPVYTYQPPIAFNLILPANGDPVTPTAPSFSWSVALGAFSYHLEVSTTSTFSALVIDEPGLTTTSFLPSSPLAGSTMHWWRVTAVNGTATTVATGAPRTFTTVSTANTWPGVGGDVRHSGYNAAETGTTPLTFAWNAGLSTAALAPVAYEGGRVFATAQTYFAASTLLWALDATTGSTQWTHDFGDVHNVGQPAVYQGRVLVGQNDSSPGTFLWSFNAANGALNWASPVGSQWEYYWSPIVAGNAVYMNGGYYGGLYGFNLTTGAQLFFNSSLEQYDEWSPAYDNNTVYTFVSGNLRAHDPLTGVIQWTRNVTWNWAGWSMKSSPVIGAGMIYVIAPPALYAINPTTHIVDWSTTGFNYTGTPAVAGGSVYAISAGILRSLNAATGAFQWSFAGDTALNHPPVIAGDHVFVSSDANVYAVRISDGVQEWTSPIGGWISVAGGKLFVSRPNGVLTAYTLTP
jgi:hypothetical protein